MAPHIRNSHIVSLFRHLRTICGPDMATDAKIAPNSINFATDHLVSGNIWHSIPETATFYPYFVIHGPGMDQLWLPMLK